MAAPDFDPTDRLEDLTDIEPLAAFREREHLDYDDAVEMLGAAIDLLSDFYVHLPLKRAMHGVDPIQRLRTIRNRLQRPETPAARAIAVRQLVDQLLSVFVSLRDMHTGLVLPEPWRSRVAFLPFLVEEWWEGDEPHYVVSKVRDPTGEFRRGVEIVEWNWIPIARAVELIADRNGGSNDAARHARGVDRLTYRWLGASAPPDEARVNIGFTTPGDSGTVHEASFSWQVGVPPVSPTARARARTPSPAAVLHAAKDDYTEFGRRLRRAVYAGQAPAAEETPWFEWRPNALRDALRWAILEDPEDAGATFGYLRIHSFDVDPTEPFVAEVERILVDADMQRTSGLIIDVRGNGGGTIDAGERILQMLTPRSIEPEPLDCLSTAKTLELARAAQSPLRDWADLIDEAIRTGAPLSRGIPVSTREDCNDRGQRYQGRVVLIVDALSYSTTDMMAAGFQDHSIGPVLGTSRFTGAGGANVWPADLVAATLKGLDPADAPPPEPDQWGLRFAVRCTRRVGAEAGRLLEDLGVAVQDFKPLTRDDVLHNNRDLLAHAMAFMKKPAFDAMFPRGRLRAEIDGERLAVTTEGLDRLDVMLDDRPWTSVDAAETQIVEIDPSRRGWNTARLDGYFGGELAASVRLAAPARDGAGVT